jgi:outer membrane pore protein F
LFSYKFDNDIRAFVSYNVLDAGSNYVIQPNYNADPNDVFKRQFVVVGLHYLFDPQTVIYIETRSDFSDFTSADKVQQARMEMSEDDGIAIGLRYTL